MNHLMKCKGISSDQMIEAHAIAKEEAITYDGKPEHLDSFVENSKSAAGRKRQRSDASTSGSLRSHFATRAPSAEEKGRIGRSLLLFFVMCGVVTNNSITHPMTNQ